MKFRKHFLLEITKFGFVGVINTLINLAVLYILTEFFGIYYLVSAIFAFLVAVTNSFILNKVWTFKEKINNKPTLKYIKFLCISIIALLINLILLYILVEFFTVWYIYAQIVGVLFNFVINYLGNKLWTFKK
ncbi:MAG TPA: GtrA family protein [Candidatus Nanoarchaeia archaeon]|nr:GtrA family protein [Candidatus Nanoarchaeia archaeon]